MRLSQDTDPYRLRGSSVPASFPIPFCLAFCWPHHVGAPQASTQGLWCFAFTSPSFLWRLYHLFQSALDAWLTGTSISFRKGIPLPMACRSTQDSHLFLHNWTACIWVHTQGFSPLSGIFLGLDFRSNITDQECNHFMDLIMFYSYFPRKKIPSFIWIVKFDWARSPQFCYYQIQPFWPCFSNSR